MHREQWCLYRLPNLNFFWHTMHMLPSSMICCDLVSFTGDKVVDSLSEEKAPGDSNDFWNEILLFRFHVNMFGEIPLETTTSLGGMVD